MELKPKHKCDSLLMLLVFQQSLTQNSSQGQINAGYLQVTKLSDIMTGNGQRTTCLAWIGHVDPYRPQYHQWPQQDWPLEQAWMEWRCMLRIALGCARE